MVRRIYSIAAALVAVALASIAMLTNARHGTSIFDGIVWSLAGAAIGAVGLLVQMAYERQFKGMDDALNRIGLLIAMCLGIVVGLRGANVADLASAEWMAAGASLATSVGRAIGDALKVTASADVE